MNKFEIILDILEKGTPNRNGYKKWEKLIKLICELEIGKKVVDDRFFIKKPDQVIQDGDYIWDDFDQKWFLITKDHYLFNVRVGLYKIGYRNFYSSFDQAQKILKKYGINLEEYIK